MDETIGERGGHNDRRRSLIISKERKKKLKAAEEEREIKELEKKVKRKNAYTLIKTLPIVVGGAFIKQIYDTSRVGEVEEVVYDDRVDIKFEDGRNIKRPKVIRNGVVVEVRNSADIKEDDTPIIKVGEGNVSKKNEEKKTLILPTGEKVVVTVGRTKSEVKGGVSSKKESSGTTEAGKYRETVKTITKGSKEEISDAESYVDLNGLLDEIDDSEFGIISYAVSNKINKLKSRKIVDEYEKQLKDIRYELRKTISEYNLLVEDSERVIFQKEAEEILDKLSIVIEKIEILKAKLRIEDLDKYDDNYIYTLIEDYLKEFRDGKLVDGIKDSTLYISISEKLDELEKKKDGFEKEVERKKDKLELKEEDFEKMKRKYDSVDKINKDLIDFENEQDKLLKEIREKIENATTVSERVETQIVGLNLQSRRLLRRLALQMMLPGPRGARAFNATVTLYRAYFNNLLNPNVETRRYRVVKVEDYHDSIKRSISSIEDALNLIGKTSKQVDSMILDIEDKFKDYIGVLSECDELLRNLRQIKRNISEKEYELEKLKKQQEKELEKNDAKVKTMGEYPVN